MKYIFLKISILILSIAVILAFAGFIKFNYFDVPYLGEPITYLSDKGKSIVVSKRVDGSIQLATPNNPRTILTHIKSSSGEMYQNIQNSLIFWHKGEIFFIEESGKIIIQGKKASSS